MEEIIILPIFFICIAYVLVNVARVIQRSRREARMAEVTTKLIDRLGPGTEVAAFISSDAYRNLLASEPAPESGLKMRIVNSVQLGAILLATGGAMLATANWLDVTRARTALGINGTVIMAVGAALLASAAWSHWMMGRWNQPRT